MRYTGYHLSGQAPRNEHGVLTVEDCWEACLQETSFTCLSVAYADGSQLCSLYDKRALSALNDWTSSPQFTYYEYCDNGELCLIIFPFPLFPICSASSTLYPCTLWGRNLIESFMWRGYLRIHTSVTSMMSQLNKAHSLPHSWAAGCSLYGGVWFIRHIICYLIRGARLLTPKSQALCHLALGHDLFV